MVIADCGLWIADFHASWSWESIRAGQSAIRNSQSAMELVGRNVVPFLDVGACVRGGVGGDGGGVGVVASTADQLDLVEPEPGLLAIHDDVLRTAARHDFSLGHRAAGQLPQVLFLRR